MFKSRMDYFAGLLLPPLIYWALSKNLVEAAIATAIWFGMIAVVSLLVAIAFKLGWKPWG